MKIFRLSPFLKIWIRGMTRLTGLDLSITIQNESGFVIYSKGFVQYKLLTDNICRTERKLITVGKKLRVFIVLIKHGGLDLSQNGLDRESRSRRRQRVSLDSQENLDNREILVEIQTSRIRLDINVQTKKSRSRSRNLSRSENFGISLQFVSIKIENCVDFCIFSLRFLNPSRTQKALTMSRFLDKSRLRLDKSRLRLDKS